MNKEDILDAMTKALDSIVRNTSTPTISSSYVYRDEDGAIHLVESSTGFHAIMSDEFYEGLLKMKQPKSFDEQVKSALVNYTIEELNNSKGPNKPWYRKERW